ncbi:hypothetical protein DL93DRAFT_2229182 [Clavulina sp. PMI_390]|nr:hypothetical protein DL93DRAFT_2229182 [Clavulina sp. PMI_390]
MERQPTTSIHEYDSNRFIDNPPVSTNPDFQGYINSLDNVVSIVNGLPNSASELPHAVDGLANIFLHPVSARLTQQKLFDNAANEAQTCLERISQIEDQLRPLRKAFECRSTQFRAKAAPLNAVPSEIMALIFEFVIEPENPRPNLRYRQIIRSVSKSWSLILRTQPVFWTTRRVGMSRTSRIKNINVLFKRSGQLPLHLHLVQHPDHFSTSPNIQIASLVNNICRADESHWLPRIKTLTVQGHEEFCGLLATLIMLAIAEAQQHDQSPNNLLSSIIMMATPGRRCIGCRKIPTHYKTLDFEPSKFPKLASFAMNCSFFSPSFSAGRLNELTLSNPSIQWSTLRAALESNLQIEKLSLIRIMPNLEPDDEAGAQLLTLPALQSLVVEAFDCSLLLSLLSSLDTPQIKHLGIGMAQFRPHYDRNRARITRLDFAKACRELAPCINSYGNLTNLTIRAYVPIQRQLVALLGHVRLPDGHEVTKTAPKLLHLSLPHLNPFRDLSSSKHRIWKLGKALEEAMTKRHSDGTHIANLKSLSIPRCLYEMRRKSLRAATGAHIITELECQCDEPWEDRKLNVDPESGWNWDSVLDDESDWYGNDDSDGEIWGDIPANYEDSFKFDDSDDSDYDYYSDDPYSGAEDGPEESVDTRPDPDDSVWQMY